MERNLAIAHFSPDEKFLDSAYRFFEEVAPHSNDFFVVSWKTELKNVKKAPTKVISPLRFKDPFLRAKLKKYDVVILHSLDKFNKELVSHSDKEINFAWIGMGHDYYGLINKNIYDMFFNATQNNFNLCVKTRKTLQDRISHFGEILQSIFYKNNNKHQVIKRINFFSPVIPSEYDLLIERIGNETPKFLEWNYSANACFFEEVDTAPRIRGNDILLGNSASFSNNHYEAIDLIKNIEIRNRRIICPLSYGNSCYADLVENYGRKKFGLDFVPLRTFLSYQEYLKILQDCSAVIMNQVRQQAVGNISLMLFMGARIFLNEDNPLYEFYNDMGITVNSIRELSENPCLLDRTVSEQEIIKNRTILRKWLGWEAGVKRTQCFLETTTGKSVSYHPSRF